MAQGSSEDPGETSSVNTRMSNVAPSNGHDGNMPLIKEKTGKATRPELIINVLITSTLAVLRITGAFVNPIADCDETFNYWEPMHYLLFGFGLQTWEYSPEFALRSYTYLYPYAAVAWIVQVMQSMIERLIPTLKLTSPKVAQFYAVRIVQGIASVCAETIFVLAVRRRVGSLAGWMLFCGLATSPGMFRAAVEFLPSSFAMICIVGAYAGWVSDLYGITVALVALASLLGWIFASVLGVPIALDLALRRGGIVKLVVYATMSGVPLLAVMTSIDSWYFGKTVIAPLNHMLYNVFPREGTGSHLYGIAPASYYAINLFLNLPVATLVFAIYPVLLLLHIAAGDAHRSRRRATLGAAAYLALAVFVAQPHKEERFLAPMYPLVALVAAIGIDDATRGMRGNGASRVRRGFSLAIVGAYVVGSIVLGASRVGMQTWAFRAPLRSYGMLSDKLATQNDSIVGGVDVCVGAEWYRFPGSMFLPHANARVRFTRAGFEGLLPMDFKPVCEGGTRAALTGFNELNQPAIGQFYDGNCDIWVNLQTDSDEGLSSQPANGISHPVVLFTAPFLDSSRSPRGLRAFYIPGWMHKLKWANYVVVRNATYRGGAPPLT